MGMLGTESAQLKPGESVAHENGERVGLSAGGRRVLMRCRRQDPRYVVTVDTGVSGDVPEFLCRDWRAATAAFDQFMHQH